MSNQSLKILLIFSILLTEVVGFLAPTSLAAPGDRPNVLLIVTDDQGWGDIGSHGNTNFQTPNMDRLAVEGARFENFYVCPVCSPTRCEILTGRYHQRCGVTGVSRGEERINLDERTMADVFQSAGYRTALFGKWHSGTQHPYHPNNRGFDEFYGFTSGHWGHYFSPRLDHNGVVVEGKGYLSDDFTDHAIDFAKDQSQPFFTMLAYNSPHSPMQVPDRWWNEFAESPIDSRATNPNREDIVFTRAALAMVANLDWNIGRILDAFASDGTLDNTIIVFMSDNGPNSERYNDGLKGKKGSVDEGGVRSPLFIRHPRSTKPGTVVQQLSGAVDLLPTLAQLCQIPLAGQSPSKPFDGISLKGQLGNSDAEAKSERSVWSIWNRKHALRSDHFLLVDNGELFDLAKDRGQKTNVASAHPDKLVAMRNELESCMAISQASQNNLRPFTLGFAIDQPDHLPARDADLIGGVKYSSIHPNCSYLTNWKNSQDQIIWHVEILDSGSYMFDVYYNCDPESVGLPIELTAKSSTTSQSVQFQFAAPSQSPIIGAAEDRVPRSESYWKNFSRFEIGSIDIEKGNCELVLSANVPEGKNVAEIALLVVTRR